jgi:chromosome partitioning protein
MKARMNADTVVPRSSRYANPKSYVTHYAPGVSADDRTKRGTTGAEDAMSLAASPERMVPIISLASTKGGVGKTTIAYVLATELARRLAPGTDHSQTDHSQTDHSQTDHSQNGHGQNGHGSNGDGPNGSGQMPRGQVTCIDTDPNRTLSQILRLTGDKLITCIESDGDQLLADLRRALADSTVVVIDLEGTANQAMLYAAGKSDLVLVPAQPSRFDVVEAVKTVGVVRKAADLVGREIAHRVVLSRTPVLRQRVADHSRSQFVRADLPLLPVELVQRAAFQSMTYTGKPPYRQEGGEQAAANVTSLVNEVLAIIGLHLPAPSAAGDATSASMAATPERGPIPRIRMFNRPHDL